MNPYSYGDAAEVREYSNAFLSEHRVRIGRRFGDALQNVPVFDDLAVIIETKDIVGRVVAAQHDAVPLPRVPTLDTILSVHAAALGDDFEGYRNHAYRVANLCVSQSSGSTEEVERIAIAAAFHDPGILTDRTFDYLMPSVSLAQAYLATSERVEWIPEITEIILGHHKISTYRGRTEWLVEPFRRADWMDVSLGVTRFGCPDDSSKRRLSCGREPDSTNGSSSWHCDASGHIPGVRCRWSGCERVGVTIDPAVILPAGMMLWVRVCAIDDCSSVLSRLTSTLRASAQRTRKRAAVTWEATHSGGR